jgi:hypothetical protein
MHECCVVWSVEELRGWRRAGHITFTSHWCCSALQLLQLRSCSLQQAQVLLSFVAGGLGCSAWAVVRAAPDCADAAGGPVVRNMQTPETHVIPDLLRIKARCRLQTHWSSKTHLSYQSTFFHPLRDSCISTPAARQQQSGVLVTTVYYVLTNTTFLSLFGRSDGAFGAAARAD